MLTNGTEQDTHPYKTPPKATNRPIRIAGAAEPAASSGFLSIKPMMNERC
jgi:hypothetical protein